MMRELLILTLVSVSSAFLVRQALPHARHAQSSRLVATATGGKEEQADEAALYYTGGLSSVPRFVPRGMRHLYKWTKKYRKRRTAKVELTDQQLAAYGPPQARHLTAEEPVQAKVKLAEQQVDPVILQLTDPSELEELAQIQALCKSVAIDLQMLRFLRKVGKKGGADKLQRTADKYTQMLAWRREARVDEVRQDILSRNLTGPDFPFASVVTKYLPVDVWRFDPASGVGLQVQYAGAWDSGGLVDAINSGELTEEQFLIFWTYVSEFVAIQLDVLSREQGELVMLPIVVDFSKASLRQVVPRFFSVVKPWVSMSQDNFPSTSGTIYMVNAPKTFAFMWKFVAPLLDEETVSRMQITSPGKEDPEVSRLLQLTPM